MEIKPCLPVMLCFFENFQKYLSTIFFPEKAVNLGGLALLSGTYLCAWASTHQQDPCLWRYDLIESQQVNTITVDDYLNNFPEEPNKQQQPSSARDVLFRLLGIIHDPTAFFIKDLGLQFNSKPKVQHQHSCYLKWQMKFV